MSSNKAEDVTSQVDFGLPDDELLPLTKCVCGATFTLWHFNVSVYSDDATSCAHCGARLYFTNSIRVWKIVE